MNTTDRLDEIQQRLDAATPGPWSLRHNDRNVYGPGREVPVAYDMVNSDQHLVAHAPDDIRYLLADKAKWEAAWDTMRDVVLHGIDQFDNDQTNAVLGVIDDHDPREAAQAAKKEGADG